MAAPAPRPAAAGCREREVARGMRKKARSARPAALRRLPAPPPCARAPTPRALRSVAAGSSPASAAPAQHQPESGARPSRGGGRTVSSRGCASPGPHAAGVWARIPRAHWPASDVGGATARCGRASAPSEGLGGAGLGQCAGSENRPRLPVPGSERRDPACQKLGRPGACACLPFSSLF